MSTEKDSYEILNLLINAPQNSLTTEEIAKQFNYEHRQILDIISYLDRQNYTDSIEIFGNGTRRVSISTEGKMHSEKKGKKRNSQLKIFYSFQSDNRDADKLIRKHITKALKNLTNKEIETKLLVDSRDATGSISIPNLLFGQIEESDIFICDVNIIGRSENGKKLLPNPNVLVELGYAAKTLGWEKIIMVYNKEEFPIEELPFDIRQRTICWYNEQTKSELSSKLLSFITRIIETV